MSTVVVQHHQSDDYIIINITLFAMILSINYRCRPSPFELDFVEEVSFGLHPPKCHNAARTKRAAVQHFHFITNSKEGVPVVFDDFQMLCGDGKLALHVLQ